MIELFIKSNMENIKYLVLSLINLAFIQKFLQFLNWEKKIVLILNFFNIRIDNNGNIASSKPCANCMNMLRTMGFKRIYYTNS